MQRTLAIRFLCCGLAFGVLSYLPVQAQAPTPEPAPANVLIDAKDKIVMAKTSMGYVLCKTGCAAYCIDTGDLLAVYNLHSTHKDDVQLLVAKQVIHMNLGEVVVCTKGTATSFDKVNPADNVGYRNIKTITVPKGYTAFSGEFSIPSVIMRVESLHKLLISGTPAEKVLLNQLLKNSVVLEKVTANRGIYKRRSNNN